MERTLFLPPMQGHRPPLQFYLSSPTISIALLKPLQLVCVIAQTNFRRLHFVDEFSFCRIYRERMHADASVRRCDAVNKCRRGWPRLSISSRFFTRLTENRERMHRYALMRCRGAVNKNVPEVSRFFKFDMSFCDTSEMFSLLQVSIVCGVFNPSAS